MTMARCTAVRLAGTATTLGTLRVLLLESDLDFTKPISKISKQKSKILLSKYIRQEQYNWYLKKKEIMISLSTIEFCSVLFYKLFS